MKFDNRRKDKFLATIPTASLDNDQDTLAQRCKFNFSYLTIPEGKTGFEAWSQENLSGLFTKLRDYCREPLSYWENVRCGKSGTVLSIYGSFPNPSKFTHPPHVPHHAQWGRFRLDWSGRLCGFVVPISHKDKLHNCGHRFDCNTFYVVFIDDNHEFYIGKREEK